MFDKIISKSVLSKKPTIMMRSLLFILFALSMLFLNACSEEESNEVNRFRIDNAVIEEGSSSRIVDVSVTLDGSLTSQISVEFEVAEGSASFGSDLIRTEGQIQFGPGELTAVMPVEVVGDSHFELSEFFEVRLTYEGDQSSYSVSIIDDDEMEPVLSDEQGFYTPDEYPSMELIWSDEFDGNQLNPDNWTYEIGDGTEQGIPGWGNEELQLYTDDEENVRLEDGKLLITAKETENSYTSARIITQDKVEVQFGRIDIRAKMPKGQGIWPALWMLGANIDDVTWPASGEIDIMELVGHEPGIVHGTVHFENNGYQTSSGSFVLQDGIFADQYHVFTTVWERNRIRWYVNNQLYKTFTRGSIGNYPFNSPFFFIMNVAVGGRWPGNPDETTEFPQQMSVDYIRMFK